MNAIPESCYDCEYSEEIGINGDLYCKILDRCVTIKPTYGPPPAGCPLRQNRPAPSFSSIVAELDAIMRKTYPEQYEDILGVAKLFVTLFQLAIKDGVIGKG